MCRKHRSHTKVVCVVEGLLQSLIVSCDLSLDDGWEKYPYSTKIRNPMKQATTAETVCEFYDAANKKHHWEYLYWIFLLFTIAFIVLISSNCCIEMTSYEFILYSKSCFYWSPAQTHMHKQTAAYPFTARSVNLTFEMTEHEKFQYWMCWWSMSRGLIDFLPFSEKIQTEKRSEQLTSRSSCMSVLSLSFSDWALDATERLIVTSVCSSSRRSM